MHYEVWRAFHGIFGTAVVTLGIYHALGLGRYSVHTPLAALWTGLVALALTSLLYVYLVKPLLLVRRPYRVTSNRLVGAALWEVTIWMSVSRGWSGSWHRLLLRMRTASGC
jgi:predicted ferric reductase